MLKIILFVLSTALLSIPGIASAATRSMTVEWGYVEPIPSDLAGFNLYMEGVKITTIPDPAARTYTGNIEYRDEKTCYTLTAYDSGGGESPHSTCYDLNISPDAPTNVRVTVVVDVQVNQAVKPNGP